MNCVKQMQSNPLFTKRCYHFIHESSQTLLRKSAIRILSDQIIHTAMNSMNERTHRHTKDIIGGKGDDGDEVCHVIVSSFVCSP